MSENGFDEGKWPVDDMIRLKRIICTAVQAAETLDADCEEAQCVLRLIAREQGSNVIQIITSLMSTDLAPPCQRMAIFLLAVCTKVSEDLKTKQQAHKAVSEVCKTSEHLFLYLHFSKCLLKETRGWGKAQRATVANWYNSHSATELAVAVTRFRSRFGWSHGDVLRLAHVKPKSEAISLVLKYVTHGLENASEASKNVAEVQSVAEVQNVAEVQSVAEVLSYLEAVERLKHSHDSLEAAALIEKFHFHMEQVPTWLLKESEVWRVLLRKMPVADILRHLHRLSAMKLLNPLTKESAAELIMEKLTDESLLKNIQPLTMLAARKNYVQGLKEKEAKKRKKKKLEANIVLVDALDSAFYKTFELIEPTQQRYMVAVSVSGTKTCPHDIARKVLTSADVAAVAVMTTVRTEHDITVVMLSPNVTEVSLTSTTPLDDVCEAVTQEKVDNADCSKMIMWAMNKKKMVDMFVVYTDSDSCMQSTPPGDLLRKYRREMDIPHAKLVVCSLIGQNLKMADPDDAGMLDISGFDSSTPDLLRGFALGQM